MPRKELLLLLAGELSLKEGTILSSKYSMAIDEMSWSS
jgi:hypothetical protein